MAFFSQKIERSELNEGDHIYTWRKIRSYTHHGIFAGEGKVIHFVSELNGEGSGSVGPFMMSSSGGPNKKRCPVSYCGFEKVSGSGVKFCCIDCFIKEGSIYRFIYKASPTFLRVKTIVAGTCTTAESDPPQEVIHRATYLHENGYVKYHLLNNNCEDFALYCKTGLWSTDKGYQGRSSQANRVHPTSGDHKISKFLSKTVDKDLGCRKDVVKVPVEELSSFVLSLK